MTHSRRRDILKATGTVTLLGGLAGCAGQDDVGTGSGQEGNETEADEPDQQDGTGAFRVAHASPDAPNVDIYVDEEPAIEDLGFREVSSYEELAPGTYQVQVTAAGDEEAVVYDEEIEIEDGTTNTAVAYGEAAGGPKNGFRVDVLEDDPSDPGDEMSRIRLFHASPDAEAVDVVVTQPPGDGGGQQAGNQSAGNETEPGQSDGPLFAGVEFGDTETGTVPAGEYTLGVVPAGGDEPVAAFDLTAESQTTYSAFATGYVDPAAAQTEDAPEFEVLTVEDAQAGERSDGGTE